MSKNYEERQAERERGWMKRMEGERVETGCLWVVLAAAAAVLVMCAVCWFKFA